jgi:hypothetical protein
LTKRLYKAVKKGDNWNMISVLIVTVIVYRNTTVIECT